VYDKNLFYATNRQSIKVMVSAALTCLKPILLIVKDFKVPGQ